MKARNSGAFFLALTGFLVVWSLFVLNQNGDLAAKTPVKKVAPASAEQSEAP